MTPLEPRRRWLLLHGTPMTPAVWDDITARLAGAGDVVTAPWIDGTGNSAAQASRLVESLGDEPRHVVGHSYGGQVAIELALQRRDLVSTLTLICSRATPFPPFAGPAALLRRGERPDPDDALARWFTPEERASGSPLLGYARQCVTAADPRAWADALDSIALFDRIDALARTGLPVLAIAAEHDQVSPPRVMRDIADRTRGVFRQLDGTSHMGPFLRPDAVAALLTEAAPGDTR
jgi:pimeloyl-ACP methyl ester carboxylesterase